MGIIALMMTSQSTRASDMDPFWKHTIARMSLGAAYVAAAVIMTWPLAAHFSTHVPSGPADQDVFLFLWQNWWVRHAIVALHAKPYITGFIYAPFTTE